MRQMFDLYVCLRPCKAYPGNPLNYKESIDLVVFRENTEDLYAGVEFHPVPEQLSKVLSDLSRPFGAFRQHRPEEYAISCKINTQAGSERIVRAAFMFAREHKRSKGDHRPQGECCPRHRRTVPGGGAPRGVRIPGDRHG